MSFKVLDVRTATTEEVEQGSVGEAPFVLGMMGAPTNETLH